jgi:hypothetical protein
LRGKEGALVDTRGSTKLGIMAGKLHSGGRGIVGEAHAF